MTRPYSTNLGKNWRVDFLPALGNGEPLRYALYHKGLGELKRCVVFLNGRSEWIEKYDYLPHEMGLESGTAFLTWDHRGQGVSGGQRSFIDTYDTYAKDAAAVISHAIPGVSYVVLAHSMGALVALYAALKGLMHPTAQVLSSPLLRLPNHPFKRKWSRPIARLLVQVGLGGLELGAGRTDPDNFAINRLTHSHEAFKRVANTPYPIGTATAGWLHATFNATDLIFDANLLASLAIPTLVVGATEESIVDPHGFSEWCQRARSACKVPVEYRLIGSARHELLNEVPRVREEVLRLAAGWFAMHASAGDPEVASDPQPKSPAANGF